MDIMRQVESLESGKGINLKCADWFGNNKQTKLTMKPTPKTERAATHRGLIKLEVLRGLRRPNSNLIGVLQTNGVFRNFFQN